MTASQITENESSQKLAYSIDEAAKALGMGKSKLYEELAAGRIKAKKSGRRTLIPDWSIREWLDTLPDFVNPPKQDS